MIRLVGQASQFPPPPPRASPAPSGQSGRVLTLRRAEDNTAIAGAAVTVDGTTTRSSDSAGRVDFPAALLPPGEHRLAIRTDDGRALDLSITVGDSGTFAQTVRLAVAGSSAAAAVAPAELKLAGAMPGGSVGTAVAGVFVAAGGTEPYAYDISVGALPGGTTIDPATGIVTGTYTADGTFDFTVHVLDAAGAEATLAVEVVVTPAGGWVDITSDTYWTAAGHHWTGSEWVMDSAPSCGTTTALQPTAAAITAMAGATKVRISLRSRAATDGSGPGYFPTHSNSWGYGATLEKNTITSSVDAAGTVYTDLEDDAFVPLTSTSESLSATSSCIGDYASDNYDFLKIEVFAP